MNEVLNRRSFFGFLSATAAGIGSALMFRKLRSPTPSVSPTPRMVPLDEQIGGYFTEHPEAATAFGLVPKSDATTDYVEAHDMLAHTEEPSRSARPPTQREKDKDTLFEDAGFFKDHIIEGLEENYNEERGYFYTQGDLSDEEFAAYQRWLNTDYPVTEAPTVRGISEEESSNDIPEPRGDVEGPALSRAA